MKGIVLLLACCCALAAGAETEPDEPEPNAQAVLDTVIARLPGESLRITGDIMVRRQRGIVVHEYQFDMHLGWGEAPPNTTYRVLDAFGAELERMTLTRNADGVLTRDYVSAAASGAAPPPMTARIQQTALSWNDLALAFLWWPDGRIVDRDTVRGRDCRVLDVPNPAATRDLDGVHSVRLWVDRELFLLLQAESRDARGKPLRKLWVRSLKKIDERWMLKDLEVQAYPAAERTRLHVSGVETVEP